MVLLESDQLLRSTLMYSAASQASVPEPLPLEVSHQLPPSREPEAGGGCQLSREGEADHAEKNIIGLQWAIYNGVIQEDYNILVERPRKNTYTTYSGTMCTR
ncbi:hypothetical protein chiPu_0014472 [Chiloscyllium punctatum]|uniref:Uncharacterized protein n=1 Tax=Chiloscyllium punctatum TaxID=137246 RepID=A0A401T006_CHIPU|nr:hypothetical protein [Chiloscyllium punctatum]